MVTPECFVSIQVLRRSAAQEAERSETTQARKLTVDIAAIHEQMATLRSSISERPGLDGGAAQLEPPIADEHLHVAQAERSTLGGSDTESPGGRRRQVSVVPPQEAGGNGSQAAGAARLTRQLSSTHSIKPYPSMAVNVAAPASTLENDTCKDYHDPKFDFHFPEPRYSKSRRRRAFAKPEDVQLAATKLEADALRVQLDQALGVENAELTGGKTAGSEVVGGPLFEAFIIVGGSVDLAGQIKTACDWWKPSKAEEEYNLLAARTEPELLTVYPPSTDAARSSLLQSFAIPDSAVRSLSFSNDAQVGNHVFNHKLEERNDDCNADGTGRLCCISTQTPCKAPRNSAARTLCISNERR